MNRLLLEPRIGGDAASYIRGKSTSDGSRHGTNTVWDSDEHNNELGSDIEAKEA